MLSEGGRSRGWTGSGGAEQWGRVGGVAEGSVTPGLNWAL